MPARFFVTSSGVTRRQDLSMHSSVSIAESSKLSAITFKSTSMIHLVLCRLARADRPELTPACCFTCRFDRRTVPMAVGPFWLAAALPPGTRSLAAAKHHVAANRKGSRLDRRGAQAGSFVLKRQSAGQPRHFVCGQRGEECVVRRRMIHDRICPHATQPRRWHTRLVSGEAVFDFRTRAERVWMGL